MVLETQDTFIVKMRSLTEKYNPERYEKGEILFHEKCRLLDNNGILDDDMQTEQKNHF